MSELAVTIRRLFRLTAVNQIKWESRGGAFYAWIGDDCYQLKRESLIGLKNRDTLSHHSLNQEDWQVLGVANHGTVFSLLGLKEPRPEITEAKEITILFNEVRARVQ